MKANLFLFILGTAGAGKSTMTNAFQSWMYGQGYDAITVNLDPGALNLPYEPEVDIRDWVRLEDVMDQYSLGPNAAQVTSSDLMFLHMHDLRQALDGFRTDYFLVDTPGQLELFAYRETTKDLMHSIALGGSCGIYLYEPMLSTTPSSMVAQLSLASTIKYRLEMPFIQVLNKIDLLDDDERERILSWVDPDKLYNDLTVGNEDEGNGSMTNEYGVELFRVLETMGEAARMIPCSAVTMEGIEDIYSMVQSVFMGGEDLEMQ